MHRRGATVAEGGTRVAEGRGDRATVGRTRIWVEVARTPVFQELAGGHVQETMSSCSLVS